MDLQVKYPLSVMDFNETWIFSTDFRKILKYQISDFTKICPVRVELFHVDGRTQMTKLIVAFRTIAKVPKRKQYFKIPGSIISPSYII
jgi:hypothetical protein